jgi:PAS domain-containing protein
MTPASTLRPAPPGGTIGTAASSISSSDPPISMVLSNGQATHHAGERKRRVEHDSESSNVYDGSYGSRAGKSQKMDALFESSSNFSFDTLVPPKPKTEEELARMTPAEKRRYERNLREQQRSYRISQQIKELRDVLAESNIPFKSNKFSILVSVTEYIKQLQSRAIMLDAEHQKLVTTINQSSSLVPPTGPSSSSEDSEKDAASLQSVAENDQDLLMVQGIDYKSIFKSCPFAIGVASLDGRVLACNEALGTLLGAVSEKW